jgi:RsmE family RNA methyltransferase
VCTCRRSSIKGIAGGERHQRYIVNVNLLLLSPRELALSGEVTLDGARAEHLLGVLRVSAGMEVRVGIIDGPLGTGEVAGVDGQTVRLWCRFDSAAPPRPRVDLLLALPRPKVMRRLWAQLAAVGVGRILLTNAERVERNYFDTHVLTPSCYEPLLLEGLQQARDTRLPAVSVHRRLKVLLEDELESIAGDACRLVAHPGAAVPPGAAAKRTGGRRVLLAVGPEGGWSPFEVALLAAHRFQPVGMGGRTLRTDTACIALLSLVHGALECA